MKTTTWWVGIGAVIGTLLFVIVRTPAQQSAPVAAAAVVAFKPAPPPAPVVEPPPATPSAEIPTLVEAGEERIERRVKALAAELTQMWTRDSERLVAVIDDASRSAEKSPSVTLLLAIAHAETNGKILDVSEAGAVGLAQATPVAYHQENFDGPLFVTNDYLVGARAYIVKKPLGDADTIASMVVERDTPKTRAKAKRLLEAAMNLRREGLEELDLLDPYASDVYFARIEAADEHNKTVLRRLSRLLDRGSRAELRAFRNKVRTEYRGLKAVQLASWKRYQKELAAARDSMLEEHFQMPADRVKKELPYEAGEYLGQHLDDRFSAKQMAAFLVRHLDRKGEEARLLAKSEAEIEPMTAALYNGGSHNVKRMLAGLIRSLPETQNYMRKVPATRRRLDECMAVEEIALGGGTAGVAERMTIR